MFNKEELILAVDLQRRSYKLLRWLSESVTRGFISFEAAHEYSSLPISSAKWIESHYENIPPDARPEKIEDINQFSAFFSTYLENSFELVSDPGQIGFKDWCCSFCNVMVDAPNLQTRKTTKSDQRKARKMRLSALEHLSSENGYVIASNLAESLVDDAEMREPTALLAYGYDLHSRLSGVSNGPAVLILWRGFAWTKEGSPQKDFNLNADMILKAELHLRNYILELRNLGGDPKS